MGQEIDLDNLFNFYGKLLTLRYLHYVICWNLWFLF